MEKKVLYVTSDFENFVNVCVCVLQERLREREREGGRREAKREKGNYSVWMSDC